MGGTARSRKGIPVPRRPLALDAAVATTCLVVALVAAPSGASAPAPLRAVSQPPGQAGSTMVLDEQGVTQLSGYDAFVDDAGTTYIAWIAQHDDAGRAVYSCTLPRGTSSCAGGVRQTAAGPAGSSSAAGLHLVDAAAGLEVVWFHDTLGGPGEIAVAPLAPDGTLGAEQDVREAPAFGGLYDATAGPGGTLATVTWSASGDTVQVDTGSGSVTLDPSYDVGQARLAFKDGLGVLALDAAGKFSAPVRVTSERSDHTWRDLASVPKNWSLQGDWDLVADAHHQVRLVASVPNANYYPQVATWLGTKFGPFRLTGYRGSCQFTTHDLYPDASGRLADAFFACGHVRIFAQPRAAVAAMASWTDTHTPVGGNSYADNGPQIATSPRGTGWLVWSRLKPTGPGDQLVATRIRVPALSRRTTDQGHAGRVTVLGPVSCLPAVDTHVGVSAHADNGWKKVSTSLRRDGSPQAGTLHGGKLAAGSAHTLVGEAVFTKDGATRTLKAKLDFTACPGPSAF